MTLRVLLADDEAPARRKLVRFLGENADIEIVGEASNGVDAIDLVAHTKPDVVFLDVQMPDLDGIGVAEALATGEHPPIVVFVTAFDRYAARAFDLDALDFLLKPYDKERFDRALERVRRSARTPVAGAELARTLQQLRGEGCFLRRLLIPNDGRSYFVPVASIVRIEADGNNVTIHAAGKTHTLRATLESFEERLDPEQFARVHRSQIVNIDAIAEIRPWFHGDYVLAVKDGSEVAWSRRYAAKRPDLLK